jgi:hypothetical protein
VNYQIGPSTSIDKAWSHLTSLRREIQELYLEKGYHKPDERVQQLLTSLLAEYRFVRGTIDARGNLDPDEVLLILKEEERVIKRISETAMFARGRGAQSGNKTHPHLSCLLYSESHRVSECQYLSEAQRHIHSSSSKVNKRRSPLRRPSPSNKDDLKALVKQLIQKVDRLEVAKKPNYKGKAFAATKDVSPLPSPPPEVLLGEEDVETAGAVSQARGELSHQHWMLDSGCSNYMTD